MTRKLSGTKIFVRFSQVSDLENVRFWQVYYDYPRYDVRSISSFRVRTQRSRQKWDTYHFFSILPQFFQIESLKVVRNFIDLYKCTPSEFRLYFLELPNGNDFCVIDYSLGPNKRPPAYWFLKIFPNPGLYYDPPIIDFRKFWS